MSGPGLRFDTVSLLTDHGTSDELVGVLKAVVRDLAPHAVVIDLSHHIAPDDVRAGALALARCIAYVPRGVVIADVAAADAERPAVAVEVAGGDGVLVGPDNGVLAPAVAMAGGAERAVALTDDAFHLGTPGAVLPGRDVFAPVAAHLCNGARLEDLGPAVDPVLLVPGTVPLPRGLGDGPASTSDAPGVVAEVLWVDRRGNCQLNLGPEDLAEHGLHDDRLRIEVPSPTGPPQVRAVTRVTGARDAGGGLALVADPYGMLSLAMHRASAAAELAVAAGDQIVLRDQPPEQPGTTTTVQLGRAR